MLPSIKSRTSLTVVFPSGSLTLLSSSPVWEEAIEAFRSGDEATLETLMSPATAISSWAQGRFTIDDDGVFWDGERLPPVLEQRIMDFWQDQLPFEPLLRFWERLQANPSRRSVEELYGFLEHRNLPINDKGFFIAYKAVRPDFMDKYSGTCFNGIGCTLAMPRRKVDDQASNTCSYGYHVGALEYVQWYGNIGTDKVLICEVDPADVVSIPVDHSAQKVRTCRYKVIGEYSGALPSTYWQPASDESFDEDEDLMEDMDDEEWFTQEVDNNICPYCAEDIRSHWEYCPDCGGTLQFRDDSKMLNR